QDPQSKTVTDEVMAAACELARWFGAEATRVYAVFAETGAQREQRKLIEFIESRGGAVSVREVMQSYSPLKDQKERTEQQLTALENAGIGGWKPTDTTTRGGRPTQVFQLLRVSTSTKPPHLRGKTGGCVDVDKLTKQLDTDSISGSVDAFLLAVSQST